MTLLINPAPSLAEWQSLNCWSDQKSSGNSTNTGGNMEMQRANGNGEPIKYFEVELENVLIAHLSPAFNGTDVATEHLGLKFSKVRWKYTQQKIGGGASGNTAGGWDLASNRIA